MGSIQRSDGYRAVADICERMGVRHEVHFGGKHAKVRFVAQGKPISIVVSVSPSDQRVYMNSRKATLRVLRQAGVMLPEDV